MTINELAPVKATREISIKTEAARVWAVLLDIDAWPTWNKAVSRARLEGPAAPGTVFRWKSGGSSIVSRLEQVEPPRAVCWSGRALGTAAIHVWTITPVDDGVVVTTSESLEGWLVRLFRIPFQRLLKRTLEDTLQALKAGCEAQSPS